MSKDPLGLRLAQIPNLTMQERLELSLQYINVLEEKLARAEEKSLRDPLTNMHNLKGFEEKVDLILKSMHPTQYELNPVGQQPRQAIHGASCYLFLDIDNFHEMNRQITEWGGDRVLEQVAEFLETHIRPGRDVSGRLAGDQFALLFTGTTAKHILRRFYNEETGLAQLHFNAVVDMPNGKVQTVPVSFSGGVVDIQPGESISDAYFRASLAMDKAKEEGRNRILRCDDYVATDPGPD
jgi:diguanylate cyclase (GGDEF)-like protein